MLCNGCQSITLETLSSPGGHLIHEDWLALSSCPMCEICKCIHQRLSVELCKAYLTQLDHDSDLAHTAEYAQERKRRWKRSASIRLAWDWCIGLDTSIYIRLFNPGTQYLPLDRRGGGPMNVYCGPHGVRDGFCFDHEDDNGNIYLRPGLEKEWQWMHNSFEIEIYVDEGVPP